MKIRLTKKFVIKALKAEVMPVNGDWCSTIGDRGSKTVKQIKDDPNCARCAVGAVVMHVLTPSATAEEVDTAARNAAEHTAGDHSRCWRPYAIDAVARRPFAALSYFFESRTINDPGYRGKSGLTHATRKKILADTVAFVEEHFPDKVTLDTDGVKKVYKKFPRVRK